jgi:hypothetical protein
MRRTSRSRALGAVFTVVAMGALAITTTATAGASVGATSHSSRAAAACAAKRPGPARVGQFSGIVYAQSLTCKTGLSDAAVGTPPLIFNGGPVMGTKQTGTMTITPIFWDPAGNTMTAAYRNIIDTYLKDAAHASHRNDNVYSVPDEYFGSNGTIRAGVDIGTPIDDTSSLSASGCTLTRQDASAIYADGSGYTACLDDAQVTGEIDRVVAADGLPVDFGHVYVMYLPKHVEACFNAGSTLTNNSCTINYEPTAAFCAYHTQDSNGVIYANMPFPIYSSPVGFTCGSDAKFPVVQTPNGNADADTEVSPTSHEVIEAWTDPNTTNGWFDSSGFEIGDECAYVYGQVQGTAGQFYNQTLGHDHYLTQEEFSNNDFSVTGLGCVQGEKQEAK